MKDGASLPAAFCSPVLAEIPLRAFSASKDFFLRTSDEDTRLMQAIQLSRFLNPVFAVKEESEKYLLVSGFRRLLSASKLGMNSIPVLWIPAGASRKALFAIALAFNDPSSLSDMDRAVAVAKARDLFEFEWQELAALAPFLGLPASQKLLGDYAGVGKMPDEIRQMIHSGRLAFKAARGLVNLNSEDRDCLIHDLFRVCEFSASEACEVAEWLSDLARKDRVSFEAVLAQPGIQSLLCSRELTARKKGEKLHPLLRTLRFPLYSSQESRFQKVKQKLEAEKGIRVENPPSFEGEYLQLTLKIHSPEDFRRVVEILAQNEVLFKNLFDLVQ